MEEQQICKMPNNTHPVTLHICMDARKDTCSYYKRVLFNDDLVSFRQGFCVYAFRKYHNHIADPCSSGTSN